MRKWLVFILLVLSPISVYGQLGTPIPGDNISLPTMQEDDLNSGCADFLLQLKRILKYSDDSMWAEDSSGLLVWSGTFAFHKDCIKRLRESGLDRLIEESLTENQ